MVMKNFLLGLSKFVLGIILAMLVMSIAGLSMARYFMTRMVEAPERPIYENDLPEAQRPRPSAPQVSSDAEVEESSAPEPEVESEPAEISSEDSYSAYVTADLNLRAGPGTSYDPIGGLNQDEGITVIGEENGWLNVILSDGSEGWVSGNYVTEE